MKKIGYSIKHIRLCMIAGVVLYMCGVLLTTILLYSAGWGSFICVLISGISMLLGIAYFLYYFKGVYQPNLELENLIREYQKTGGLNFERKKQPRDNEDLLKELNIILTSLDGMAIRQKNAEILMKNAEINNLQDQINPHFLYNTLEVVRGEALAKGEKKIAEMTASLANYFRYNISRRETFVFLKDELKNSMNYFNIQKNRFGDKISCEILYHDVVEKDVENCYIPKLILQPVIENAIYHGLELKLGEGKIRIHITAADSKLKITVTDDGLGMRPEKVDELNRDYDIGKDGSEISNRHNGVAMRNIKKRLKLYWGDRTYMYVASELGNGTQIHMSMPLLYRIEETVEQQ